MDPIVEMAVEAFQRLLSLEKSMENATHRLQRTMHLLDADQLAEYVRRTEEMNQAV